MQQITYKFQSIEITAFALKAVFLTAESLAVASKEGWKSPLNLLAITKARGGGDVKVLNVAGKWIEPRLGDLHSHIGVYSSPPLNGMSFLRYQFLVPRQELAQESHPTLASNHRRAEHT